ncbi:lipase 3-like isoform X1 [Topomyia yanbarensis]|uniref:lipase 3-like isoform X1 n=1 Tax=Topomyia yanbarensis TaxID=2498891 RepID=UPI00273C4FC2|nr:lipase 3-like isoform X1 [Topomyia yanbarensis]
MKVIPQLVLIVIPSFIRTETSCGVSESGDDGRLLANETFEPRARRIRRLSSDYERDLVMDTIQAADYPANVHVVVTKDSYILKLHRIPDPALEEDTDDDKVESESPTDNDVATFRGVVLLMHGMFSTAADFVVTGPENGLAFILADAGYDVWLGNARGTRFSRKNLNLNPKSAAFWDFSWHEIGINDLPAMIDYILLHTKQRKLFYIGHNQGVTAMLALLSEKPAYNRKIIAVTGMAPLVFLGNGNIAVAQQLAKFNDQLWLTLKSLNIFELTPSEKVLKFLGSTVCSEAVFTGAMCFDLLTTIFGYSSEQAKLLLPGLMDNLVTGISTKQLIHYGQLMETRKFQQFDYKNFVENFQRYKQGKPPYYDLSKVTIPFTLFYGTKDFFSSSKDFKKLIRSLPNVATFNEIPGWTHMDFIYNTQIYVNVYSKILESMKNCTNI